MELEELAELISLLERYNQWKFVGKDNAIYELVNDIENTIKGISQEIERE